jgi:hypothetical protein
MENSDKQMEQTHLQEIIRQQKELNDSLRASANILHSLVQKLSGDYPNLIYEYDNQEKKQALTHIDKLQMNNLDYEAIQRDINYSLENLERSI